MVDVHQMPVPARSLSDAPALRPPRKRPPSNAWRAACIAEAVSEIALISQLLRREFQSDDHDIRLLTMLAVRMEELACIVMSAQDAWDTQESVMARLHPRPQG